MQISHESDERSRKSSARDGLATPVSPAVSVSSSHFIFAKGLGIPLWYDCCYHVSLRFSFTDRWFGVTETVRRGGERDRSGIAE